MHKKRTTIVFLTQEKTTKTRPSILCVTHQVVKREIIQYGVVLGELGQFWAVVAGTWWYRVSLGWYWLVHGGTGSV